jgi:hypothetical protein
METSKQFGINVTARELLDYLSYGFATIVPIPVMFILVRLIVTRKIKMISY